MADKKKESPHLAHLRERAMNPKGGLDIGVRTILRMRELLERPAEPTPPPTTPPSAENTAPKPAEETVPTQKKEEDGKKDKKPEKKAL